MEPKRYALLAVALIAVGGILAIGMGAVHRVYSLYDYAC